MKRNLALCLCLVFASSGLLACTDSKDDDKEPCKAADYPQCEGAKLLSCVDGFLQKQTCSGGCDDVNKVCKFAVLECSPVDYPKCDGSELLTCIEGTIVKETCSAGCDADTKACKLEENECEAADYPKCDGDKLLSCANGKVESQTCSAGCDADTKACKLEEIECDATHEDSCNGNMRVLCENNVVVEKACKAKEICVDGACKADESSPLDQDCEYGVFVENCYLDDLPLVCPQKYKKVDLHPDHPNGCKAKGLVCGTTTKDEITLVDCFEPCTVLDETLEFCGLVAGTVYEWVDKCIKIGTDSKKNPVYGYEQIQGTFNKCNLGCEGSKCKANDDLGKPCDDNAYLSKCDGNVSVYCNINEVEAEDCGKLACVAGLNSSDACLEPCTAGDPDKRKCIPFLGKYATTDYSCKAVGSESKYYYTKGMDIKDCPGLCEDGVCK